jgi:hypothetical protein
MSDAVETPVPPPPADGPESSVPADPVRRMRFLNIIAWVAIVDVILLIPLIWASRWVADNEGVVGILGPVHGFLFIALIGLCAYGSMQKWWGWWFPVLVVVTLGPLGSLIGDWIIRRQIKAEAA